jgi:O-antigen/teichoic acid export membrane protein
VKPFTATGDFAPVLPDRSDSLRWLAARGASMTALSGFLTLGIQIFATVTLARLLSPREIGLVIMVTTFSELVMNCGYAGITDAVVQCNKIDNRLASALFWINLGAGLFLAVVFSVSGRLFARLYHEPLLIGIAAALSLSIVFNVSSVLHLALLRRAMCYGAIARNSVAARIASVAVSVGCAWMGCGYWSIVAGVCALPASTAIGAFLLCRWKPLRPASAPGVGPQIRFALHAYGRFAINYATRNTDNLLVGSFFGAHALGFYKRAYDLFAMTASQMATAISSVAISSLSRLRDNAEEYNRFLLSALSVTAFVGMGIAGATALTGPDLIRLLLGPGWDESGRIFTFFAPGIGIMLIYNAHNWIHPSQGHADRWFRWSIVEFFVTCALFIAALRWGPEGIAAAWTLSFWVLTAPALWYACRPFGLTLSAVLASVWRYLAASLAAGLSLYELNARIPLLPPHDTILHTIQRILALSTAFLFSYLALVVLLHFSFRPLTRMVVLVRNLRNRQEA